MRREKSVGDWIFDIINLLIMIIIVIAVLYPFINSLAISLNDANDTTRGGISLFPRVFTMRNYKLVFTNPKVYNAYFITISRTVIGTISALFFTAILSYGLAHNNLMGKKFYMIICIIPMYFSGGLMPFYFLIKWMGLTNNFFVYILPNMVGIFNMLLMRTYFQGLPASLEESARIDGAGYLKIFFKIIIPISTPIIATIALFIGVWQWNSWFDASIYITKQNLKPMQSVLLSIISEAKFAETIAASAAGSGGAGGSLNIGNIGRGAQVNVRSITMATMFITIIPIMLVYPFLQRYFIKGIMIGSIKG